MKKVVLIASMLTVCNLFGAKQMSEKDVQNLIIKIKEADIEGFCEDYILREKFKIRIFKKGKGVGSFAYLQGTNFISRSDTHQFTYQIMEELEKKLEGKKTTDPVDFYPDEVAEQYVTTRVLLDEIQNATDIVLQEVYTLSSGLSIGFTRKNKGVFLIELFKESTSEADSFTMDKGYISLIEKALYKKFEPRELTVEEIVKMKKTKPDEPTLSEIDEDYMKKAVKQIEAAKKVVFDYKDHINDKNIIEHYYLEYRKDKGVDKHDIFKIIIHKRKEGGKQEVSRLKTTHFGKEGEYFSTKNNDLWTPIINALKKKYLGGWFGRSNRRKTIQEKNLF